MKNLAIFLALFFATMFTGWAAIRTVDNTPGSAAQYSSIQNAVNAANSGDTILVYGSPNAYGSVNINKKVILIGTAGVDPEVNNENAPVVANINFNANSTPNGTVISGFRITGSVSNNGYTVDDVGVYNNFFYNTNNYYGIFFYYGSSSNWIVEGNVFQANGQYSFFENYLNAASLNNILFKNNYFETSNYYYYIISYGNAAVVFRNNVFIFRGSSGYHLFYGCNNMLLENNIFWFTNNAYTDVTGQQCANCVFNNNIIYNSGGATMTAINAIGNGVSGNNNIMNVDPQFVNFVLANGFTIGEDYRLASTSPGKNAGTDGTDIGLYGANYNWENRKYPKAFPHQAIFNVINSSVPQGTPVNVQLKARKSYN
jgi:hypothetical protein